MSHFTVIVIGDNIEEQLSPFDENLELPLRKRDALTEADKTSMVDWYKEHNKFEGTFEECIALYGNDWNGDTWKKDYKGDWYEFSNYNDQAQWDWYSVGGRWTGYFKPKTGKTGEMGESGSFNNKPENGYVDVIKKGDLDFDGMREDSKQKALAHYKLLESCFPDGFPKMNIFWKDVNYNSEKEKGAYHNQPAKLVLKNIDKDKLTKEQQDVFTWVNLEDYQCTLEEYGEKAYNSSISPFAMVLDYQWIEKGSMGWFGVSSDEMEQNDWDSIVNNIIDELDDETTLTLVDCHI